MTENRTDRKPSCPDCGREATISTTSEGNLYCYECGASVKTADLATKLSELRVLELRADVAYLKALGTQGTYGLTRSQIGSRIRGKLALIHRLAEES